MGTNRKRETGNKAAQKSPVTLRLGELEPAVEERAAGGPLGSIVRRDLARYYRLIRDYRIYEGLSVDDADVIAYALREFDDAAYQYIWAAVDDVLKSRDLMTENFGTPSRFSRVDREQLNRTLRRHSLEFGRKMAILDAVERYWLKLGAAGVEVPFAPESLDADYPVSDPELDAMVEVGLTAPLLAALYRGERDSPARARVAPRATTQASSEDAKLPDQLRHRDQPGKSREP